jgi:hypothetical protein
MENTFVVTGKARFSYVSIFQPRKSEDNADPRYELTLLIPKTDKKTYSAIMKAIDAAAAKGKSKFGDKWPSKPKNTLKDGDGYKESGDEYGPECKGHWVLRVSSKTRPQVVDRDRNDIIDPTEVYSGCYGRASINFYPFVVPSNKGVTAGLQNVQKLADGEALGGGRTSAANDFSADWDEDDDI